MFWWSSMKSITMNDDEPATAIRSIRLMMNPMWAWFRVQGINQYHCNLGSWEPSRADDMSIPITEPSARESNENSDDSNKDENEPEHNDSNKVNRIIRIMPWTIILFMLIIQIVSAVICSMLAMRMRTHVGWFNVHWTWFARNTEQPAINHVSFDAIVCGMHHGTGPWLTPCENRITQGWWAYCIHRQWTDSTWIS